MERSIKIYGVNHRLEFMIAHKNYSADHMALHQKGKLVLGMQTIRIKRQNK